VPLLPQHSFVFEVSLLQDFVSEFDDGGDDGQCIPNWKSARVKTRETRATCSHHFTRQQQPCYGTLPTNMFITKGTP